MVPSYELEPQPTYYKSVDEGISSLIMEDSKRLWSHPSNKISWYYNSTTLKIQIISFDRLIEMKIYFLIVKFMASFED